MDAVSIEKRPKIVDKRGRTGNFDRRKSKAGISFDSRTQNRTGVNKKSSEKTAEKVKDAIIELLTPIKYRVKTITSDNG